MATSIFLIWSGLGLFYIGAIIWITGTSSIGVNIKSNIKPDSEISFKLVKSNDLLFINLE